MKTNGNTILITGGATGIGFALAEAFVKADNKVLKRHFENSITGNTCWKPDAAQWAATIW